MVHTFDGDAHLLAQHATMAEASAALEQGAYTTFRTYGRDRILRLGQHLRRLEESLSLMIGLPAAPIDDVRARATLAAALAFTGYAESRFRLTYGSRGLFVSVESFTPYDSSLYADGVRCSTVTLHRTNPHAKSTTFIASAAQAYKALPAGVHEGLMVADDGAILEGLSSNFFAVTTLPVGSEEVDGGVPVLRTEEARVLIGVTRSLVLEVAAGVLPVTPVAVRYADLPRVTECFITSVSREILPVVQIDERVVGDGKPGPITRELMRRFGDLVAREAERIHA
jgi:branched-chain amino acid aminotransferase